VTPLVSDWKKIEVVFNSQDNDEVTLYAGVWAGKSGTVWVDEVTFEELSLVNVLRLYLERQPAERVIG
jgi:hypothetical protein